jgi:hypothetical protein
VVVAREDRYALMPWGVATVDYGRRSVVFDVTPQVVQPLFFARDAWPDVADPQFGRRVQDAFGPRAIRRESARPAPDAPRPAEPKAKAQARPGRGPDAPAPPSDQPKSRAKESRPEAPPDRPKAKARAEERGPDASPPPDRPKAKARAEERGPDASPPPDRPKAKVQEKSGRP